MKIFISSNYVIMSSNVHLHSSRSFKSKNIGVILYGYESMQFEKVGFLIAPVELETIKLCPKKV